MITKYLDEPVRYRNPWAKQSDPDPFYISDVKPVEYKGYLIYHRIRSNSPGGDCFDIVQEGVCVSQYAGLNGAKKAIDEDDC